MRSVREMLDDLLQVRIDPTSISQWYVLMDVTKRARSLLTDVMQTYEFQSRGVLYSQGISGMPVTIALPKNVTRVNYIDITAFTQGVTRRRPVLAFRHIPTAQTNLLYLDEVLSLWSMDRPVQYWLEIGYEESAQQHVLPPDVRVLTAINTAHLGVTVTGGRPVDRWPCPGYIELTSPVTTTDAREVAHYQFVSATGFSGMTRAVEGQAQSWTTGAVVSFVPAVPNAALPVWMDGANAALYDALVADRAFYDKYNAIASEQASPPERLVGLARTFEDKADRTFRRTRSLPQPAKIRVRRFRR